MRLIEHELRKHKFETILKTKTNLKISENLEKSLLQTKTKT